MVKLFDATFMLGTVLVVLAVGIAVAAITREDLPLVGTGVGALIAVAVVGMVACAVAGVSQAPIAGWTIQRSSSASCWAWSHSSSWPPASSGGRASSSR